MNENSNQPPRKNPFWTKYFKNQGFGKTDTSKVKIINPVSSPEKVSNKSQIKYKIRCVYCQQVNSLPEGIEPQEGFIITCPRCYTRLYITKVSRSDINPFDFNVAVRILKDWEYRKKPNK